MPSPAGEGGPPLVVDEVLQMDLHIHSMMCFAMIWTSSNDVAPFGRNDVALRANIAFGKRGTALAVDEVLQWSLCFTLQLQQFRPRERE